MSKTTTEPKNKPTYQEDYDRAKKLIEAYADMKKELEDHKFAEALELKPIIDRRKAKIEACVESMKAAEVELSEIGLRNKKKFIKNRLTFGDIGYLLLSNKTMVVLQEAFDFSKFIKKFPLLWSDQDQKAMGDYATLTFNVKGLTPAFNDGDRRPKLMAHGIDLKNDESIQVKITNKLSDKPSDGE